MSADESTVPPPHNPRLRGKAAVVQLVNGFTVANVNEGLSGTGITVEALTKATAQGTIAQVAYESRLRMLWAHGWLMLVAWGYARGCRSHSLPCAALSPSAADRLGSTRFGRLLLPSGALVPRAWRAALPQGGWFNMHLSLQLGGLTLTAIGVGLAIGGSEVISGRLAPQPSHDDRPLAATIAPQVYAALHLNLMPPLPRCPLPPHTIGFRYTLTRQVVSTSSSA